MNKFLFFSIIVCCCLSCIDDEYNKNYRNTNKVSFLNEMSSIVITSGEEVELIAPIKLSQNVDNIDDVFNIKWFAFDKEIGTGYKLKYTFNISGGTKIMLKVINNETGEIYISPEYALSIKDSNSWGWMLLSEGKDGKSKLSFISPQLRAYHEIDSKISGGLGNKPYSINYYYVLGSIPASYVSGVPKILINQGSGSVTLDGNTLQKDLFLKDEFSNGVEPLNMNIKFFGWKYYYYIICTDKGEIYVRNIGDYTNATIPYYGKYTASPMEFKNGADISCMAPFHNVTYWCCNEYIVMMYDRLNSRFIACVEGDDSSVSNHNVAFVYLSNYDKEYTLPANVLPVENLGSGTECLAIGAYEKIDIAESGSLNFWSRYVALLNINGIGNYCVYEFSVNPISYGNHIIKDVTQKEFSGSSLINKNSVILMSSNFEKNPYFYFTDGGSNLYVYSMKAGTHKLAYKAKSKITNLCASPIVCEFKKYGGNNEAPNYRIAVAQEDGSVSVIDVAQSKIAKLFEGFETNLELCNLTGFGNVKGIEWCTNYSGEY